MLWTATVYLVKNKPRRSLAYLMTLFPAAFMTAVCTAYICTAKIGFNMPNSWNYIIGIVTFIVAVDAFYIWKFRPHIKERINARKAKREEKK